MSSAVYQPTTITYESNGDRWQDRPISYLASTVTDAARAPCGISCVACRGLCPVILLTSCVTCFIIGIVLLIQGAFGYTEKHTEDNVYMLSTIFGVLFFGVSCFLFVIFLRMTRRWCWASGKDHLDMVGNQSLNINPSTDLLVTAQYAPVSEVAYQPAAQEDTEQSKLMPQENKDLLKDDTDCMIERDPRIVLRPLNQTINEDT